MEMGRIKLVGNLGLFNGYQWRNWNGDEMIR